MTTTTAAPTQQTSEAKTIDELIERLNESGAGEAGVEMADAMECAESCETADDFVANLKDARKAALRLVAELDAVLAVSR